PLPRRMWAGSRIDFLAPVPVGAALTRVTTIDAIKPKRGASGALLFVTLRHEISADGADAIREEQDIVFREAAGATPTLVVAPAEIPEPADAVRSITPDPVLLFRYSALTFNAHRIHYDRDYARDVEGYAGLVVHGPLIATLLMGHALRAGLAPRRFAFRAEAPLIDGAPFHLCLAHDAQGARLWARDAAGRTKMRAELCCTTD
ncbi:MAG TPA: MaoC family dehydratase N-terminal domain-containing protein, partial [Sphingopyxis sp.]|nr:MaoC family dehydratase N-terminal domain-containing protein [Sphingopyxis sp.]